MAKHNIQFTSDGGMKVGVKQMSQEKYADATQKKIVEAWNFSSWPEYKSRLWNQEAEINKRSGSHRSNSRHNGQEHNLRSGSPSNGANRPGVTERSSSWFKKHHSHES